MSWKLAKVEKLTDDKWINLYSVCYKNEKKKGKMVEWCFSSRRNQNKLTLNNKAIIGDAVVVAPIIKTKKGESFLLIKEFRFPLNNYIYSFPAGLVNEGESLAEAAVREAKEEVGVIGKITEIANYGYNSAGASDETVAFALMEVDEINKKEIALDFDEDIKAVIVPVEEFETFKQDKHMSIKCEIFCSMYAREYKLKRENQKLKEELEKLKN